MPDCPSDGDLSGFLNDTLAPDRVTRVSSHVDECPECQIRLDKLTHDTDGAVARYQEISSLTSAAPKSDNDSVDSVTHALRQHQLPSARLVALPRVPGFDMISEIGRGRTGVVYKARHRRLNRLCALK